MSAKTDTRDVKVDILLLWKESTKRILKRRVKNEKKLIIFKIVRFEAYRPVAAIKNDSEENI